MRSPAELRVIARVSDLIREAMELRDARRRDIAACGALKRVLSRTEIHNIKLASLVKIADDLGFEVIINFRDRSAQDVLGKRP